MGGLVGLVGGRGGVTFHLQSIACGPVRLDASPAHLDRWARGSDDDGTWLQQLPLHPDPPRRGRLWAVLLRKRACRRGVGSLRWLPAYDIREWYRSGQRRHATMPSKCGGQRFLGIVDGSCPDGVGLTILPPPHRHDLPDHQAHSSQLGCELGSARPQVRRCLRCACGKVRATAKRKWQLKIGIRTLRFELKL